MPKAQSRGCLQDVTNPEATGAIVAAGATSAVRAMLEQNMRMHVLLLAITPRGERCAAPAKSGQLFAF